MKNSWQDTTKVFVFYESLNIRQITNIENIWVVLGSSLTLLNLCKIFVFYKINYHTSNFASFPSSITLRNENPTEMSNRS